MACTSDAVVVLLPAEHRVAAIPAHRGSANPRLRLAGTAGLLLPGSHNGCWS